jgi:hypothetical protein
VLEAPRHPMNMQLTGDRLRRNPTKALYMLSVRILIRIEETYIGVGLPKVFLNSPATLFWGDR